MRASKRPTGIRKAEITQAALALISRGGLKALSVAAVARNCGLVPSAVYRHFKGKEEVVDAVLDLIGGLLEENVSFACRESTSPADCLHRLFERHIRMILENRGIPRLIFSDEIYRRRADRKRKVFAFITLYLEGIERLVRLAQEKGQMNSAHSPQTWAYLFLGLVQPAAILWHLSDGKADIVSRAHGAWEAYRDLAFPSSHTPPMRIQ
jgi:AcrR family transcriptional regulator